MLFVIVSLTSITLGAVITLQAQTRPVQRHRLEYIGGLLIIAGLAVIGIGLAKLGAGFPSLAGQ